MTSFWLVPVKPLKAFETAITFDSEKKMCNTCKLRKSKESKSKSGGEQLDAFPDYPKK